MQSRYALYPGSAVAKAGVEVPSCLLPVRFALYAITVNSVIPRLLTKEPARPQIYAQGEQCRHRRVTPLGHADQPDTAAIVASASRGAGSVTRQVAHVTGGTD